MARTAFISGAASGIGRGCVAHLLGAGWRVAAADIDASGLAALAEAHSGAPLLILPGDLAEEPVVLAHFARIADWAPEGLALSFHNAGIAGAQTGPVEQLSLAEWRRRVDASLTATFLCARSAAPLLRRARGAMVNMASTRAFQSEPDSEAYAAAKGGIVALTHALAVSLGPEVRVNAIAPGWIETRHLQPGAAGPAPAHSAAEAGQHPAGRVGLPQDIAEALLWLADAGFVTGQTVTIDGGMSKRMIYEA